MVTIVVSSPSVYVVTASVGRAMAADVVTTAGAVGVVAAAMVEEAVAMATSGCGRGE